MKAELIELSKDEEKGRVSLRLIITGTRQEPENGIICIQPPWYAVPGAHSEICVSELAENEEMTLDLQYEFLYGGRYVFWVWERNNKLATLKWTIVSIKGAGMYSGNTHSHSTYSDGKSTLEENRRAMMDCGHSFIYATEHNTTAHFPELAEYVEKGKEENFLHIPGWEYTTKYGHSIAYGSRETYDVGKIPERNCVEAWQKFADTMKAQEAVVFLAHPYEAPKYEFGEDVLKEIVGIAGVEAWNGYNFHALAYQNRKNFEAWDLFNSRGDGHYTGNAVSDAHTQKGQSSPYIKGYLKELSQSAVEEMLVSGRFIGSNGPEIIFSIGNAEIGETYKVSVEEDKQISKVLMKLEVFDPLGGIEAVSVYRGVVDGIFSAKPNTVKLFEFYPMGELEKRNFEKNIFLDVKPGEFYRVEVITEVGVVTYMADSDKIEKGFAYTNPIWIEE